MWSWFHSWFNGMPSPRRRPEPAACQKKRHRLLEVERLEPRDLPSTLGFTQPTVNVAENPFGPATATFSVNLSPPSSQTVKVDFATKDDSAKSTVPNSGSTGDYTTTNGTLIFQPGETSKTISVPILYDTNDRFDESFFVDLANVQGPNTTLDNNRKRATGIILDDSVPSLSIDSPTVSEGAGTASVRVSLSGPYSLPITAYYQTSNGSATAPGDYQAGSGTLTFQPGQTELFFSVPIVNDTTREAIESLTVKASAFDGNSPAWTQNTNTVNSNFLFQLYSDVLKRPVDSSGLATWLASLGGGQTRQQVAAAVQLSDEYLVRVISGYYFDYLSRPPDSYGQSSWLALLHQQTSSQEAVQVGILASNEYFQNHGGNSNYGFVYSLYKDVLRRENPLQGDPNGVTGWVNALTHGATRTQVANALVRSVEAYQGVVKNLYQLLLHRQADPSGLNTWVNLLQAPGQAHGIEKVQAGIIGSQEYSGRLLGSTAQGTLTIVDDDTSVKITATDPTAAETGSGTTPNPGSFTITRTQDLSADLPVYYTLPGNATSGADYSPLTNFVVIPAGSPSVTVSINPFDDQLVEGPETVTATLSSAPIASYTVDSQFPQASISIADNDAGLVLSRPAGSQSSQTDTYLVTLSVQPTGNVTVSLTADSQLTVSPASLTFNASTWNAPQTVWPAPCNWPCRTATFWLLPSSFRTRRCLIGKMSSSPM